jgi:hypothetical protein
MLALLVVIFGAVALEVLVWRYGADSRDGNDWAPAKPVQRSPLAR